MHDSSSTNTDKTDVYGKMLVFTTRAGGGAGCWETVTTGRQWYRRCCFSSNALATGAHSVCASFTER